MGKLPSQPEFTQKETYQAITLRSDKEVEGISSKKKIVINDDKVEIEEVEVSDKKDDECAIKSKKGDTIQPKEDEPNVDFKILPFPQQYIRRNLDKQFGKFRNYLKELTITLPFVEAIRDIPAWGKFFKDIISHKNKLEIMA